MPPGTSELHQELFCNLNGEILFVTTPQNVSYVDLIRSIDFVKRLDVKILGVIDNFAYLRCESCNKTIKLYTDNTKIDLCDKINLPYLMAFEIDAEISKYASQGIPYMSFRQDSETFQSYLNLSDIVMGREGYAS